LVDLRTGEYRGLGVKDVTDGVGLETDDIVSSYRSILLLIATVIRQVQSGTTSDLRDLRPRHRIRSFGYGHYNRVAKEGDFRQEWRDVWQSDRGGSYVKEAVPPVS
jgi:hypothetical protein